MGFGLGDLASVAAGPMGILGQQALGATNSDFRGTGANLFNPVTAGQLTGAQTGVEDTLAQQQAFVNALKAQGGIQNQSDVYSQLQGIAAGTGPNPAQAMLSNATGQNVANQASLMASQRGAGANPGMIARLAAQQGANIQQQAVGQGAALQANQSLNAIGQAGGIAGQQVQNQANAVGANAQLSQNAQQNLLNAQSQFNNAQVGNQSNLNNVNAGMESGNAQRKTDLIGGLLKGAGSAAAMAEGGIVPPPRQSHAYADGGAISNAGRIMSNAPSNQSPLAQFSDSGPSIPGSRPIDPDWSNIHAQPSAKGTSRVDDVGTSHTVGGGQMSMMSRGGAVPAKVSPGERYLPPSEVAKVAKGEKAPMKAGEKIKGDAKVKGAKDSYANDTVSKTLQSGGIVLPRSVTQAKDAPKRAAEFVAQILAKQGLKK